MLSQSCLLFWCGELRSPHNFDTVAPVQTSLLRVCSADVPADHRWLHARRIRADTGRSSSLQDRSGTWAVLSSRSEDLQGRGTGPYTILTPPRHANRTRVARAREDFGRCSDQSWGKQKFIRSIVVWFIGFGWFQIIWGWSRSHVVQRVCVEQANCIYLILLMISRNIGKLALKHYFQNTH